MTTQNTSLPGLSNATLPEWYWPVKGVSSVGFSMVLIIVLVVTFVAMFLLRSNAIVKSRRVVSILTVLAHFLSAVIHIFTAFPIAPEIGCYAVSCVAFPVFVSIYILYLFQYLDFGLQRLNQRIKTQATLHRRSIRLLNMINNPVWKLLLLIALCLGWHAALWPSILFFRNSAEILGIDNPSRCNDVYGILVLLLCLCFFTWSITCVVFLVLCTCPRCFRKGIKSVRCSLTYLVDSGFE